MEFTGERMVPTAEGFDDLFLEHVSRYVFASSFLKKGDVVLDAGCGCGYGSYRLRRAGAGTVLGIDVSEEAVLYCRDNYGHEGIKFETRSVLQTGLPSRSFDAVVSFEVFEHLENPGDFLDEMRRILKPNGLFVVSTPNAHTYVAGGKGGENEFHVREYLPEEFEEQLSGRFRAIRWYAQSPIGGLGILPVAAHDGPESMPMEARLVAPPSRSTWGETRPPAVTLEQCAYMLAVCSPEPALSREGPAAAFFAMGDEHGTMTGQVETLVRNRDSLAEDVERRDEVIVDLREELERRSEWARGLQKEIDERDETIRKLQAEYEDRSRWALELDAQVKEMREERERLKRSSNESTLA